MNDIWKRMCQRAICLHLGLRVADWGDDPDFHQSDATGISLYARDLNRREQAIARSFAPAPRVGLAR